MNAGRFVMGFVAALAACGAGAQAYPQRALRVIVPFSTGTAADIVARLNSEIARGMRDPAVIKRLAGEGVDAVTSSPEEFAARVKSEMEKWGKVVRAAGIKPE